MNRPPKNRTSVTRNTHMPERGRLELLLHAVEVVLQPRMVRSVRAPSACAGVPSAGRARALRVRMSVSQRATSSLRRVVVRRFGHDRRRRRSSRSAAATAIVHSRPVAPHGLAGASSPLNERVGEVDDRQQVAERRGPTRRPSTARSAPGTRPDTRGSGAACPGSRAMNCGKNVRLNPTKTRIADDLGPAPRSTSGRSSSATRSAGRPGSAMIAPPTMM